MTTFAEAQRWLRQKKASGRLSPTEEQQAYQAYFSTEAGNLNDRARIEQQAQRDAVTKSQGAERLAQEGRKVALYEQEAKDKADALETQGRLQLAKIAVPDLFMEGGGNGGGAQGETQSALGTSQIGSRESGRAVDSLSTETYSPNAFAPESKSYSMQSVTGKTLGGMFTNTIGTKGQNAKAAAIAGKEGVIAGWGLRGANEIMGALIGFGKNLWGGTLAEKNFTSAFNMEDHDFSFLGQAYTELSKDYEDAFPEENFSGETSGAGSVGGLEGGIDGGTDTGGGNYGTESFSEEGGQWV